VVVVVVVVVEVVAAAAVVVIAAAAAAVVVVVYGNSKDISIIMRITLLGMFCVWLSLYLPIQYLVLFF
jgi:hypothetical protein